MKSGRAFLVFCITAVLAASFFGCAAPNRMMIHPVTGKTVDCSSFGYGVVGATTALVAAEQCAKRYQDLGYLRLDEYKKQHKDGGLLSARHPDLESLIAHLKENGYDHLLENKNISMRWMIDLTSVMVTDEIIRFQLAEIPFANHNSVRYVSYLVERQVPTFRLCGVYEDTNDKCAPLPEGSAVSVYRAMILNGKIEPSDGSRPNEYYTVRDTVRKLRKDGYSRLYYAPSNDSYLMLKADSVKSEDGYTKLILAEFSASDTQHKDYLYIVDPDSHRFVVYPAGSENSGVPTTPFGDASPLGQVMKDI